MDDEKELQEIRRRKLESMQQEQAQEDAQSQVDEQYEQQRQAVLRQILSPEARARLARLKIARAEFAEAVENQLIMLAQSGKLQAVIDDQSLVQILERLTPEKREITIKRK
ncbi:MAG: DNA-binding protein [Thermoplasmata archaeon]|nr:DNA-binding protein [Thermoplasmata archaeon]